MPLFSKVCCFTLKTGCKTIASLGIILNICLVGLAVVVIVGGSDSNVPRNFAYFYDGSEYRAASALHTAGSLLFLSSLISLAVNGCLIHGVNHLKDSLLVPSLVFIPLHCICVVVLLATSWFPEVISIIVSVLLITVYVLIWLIIFASWQQIREVKRGDVKEEVVKS